jgi:hypothetical protein
MDEYIKREDAYKAVLHQLAGTSYHSAVLRAIEAIPAADVAPKSEAENWHHEYHVIKDALKQEKMYHRETEKLVDKYFTELKTAKSEVAREIFKEIAETCVPETPEERGRETQIGYLLGVNAFLKNILELKQKYTKNP